jgi:Helix-turn-helix domain
MSNKLFLTPAAVAARLGVAKVDVIYAHIAAGNLRAVNVSVGNCRPCWRIREVDLEEFLAGRAAVPATKPTRRHTARRLKVTRYF